MTRRLATVLLLVGGLLYSNWVAQLVLPVHLSPFTSYVSELSALSRPHHSAFRAMDILSGLTVAAGAALGMCAGHRSRVTITGWIAVALFGLSNVMDALTPLTCTITVPAACRTSQAHGLSHWLGDAHVYASLGEEVFFTAAWIAICIALRSSGDPMDRFPVIVGAVAVTASIVAGVLTADLAFLGHDVLLGLAQRLEVVLMAVWVAVVPGRMLVPTRPRTYVA